MRAGPGRCGCVASDAGRRPAGHTPAGSLGVATPRLIPRGERAPGERQAPPCERGSGIKARAVILASGSAVLVDALRGAAGVDEHAITVVCPAALVFLDALGLPSSPPSPSAAASRCSASSRKPHREPGTTGSRATASSSSHRLAGATLFWSPSCLGAVHAGPSGDALQACRLEGVRGRHERHDVRARHASRTDDGHDAGRNRSVRK